ncbi:MAG: hypothetical protein KIS78_17425 [Labilithrix sp.]|nr:hypothetical protein [Labilithrix sp.]MCW5834183.1 hypothetical protein [Labilithrix sp.]
MSPRAFSAAVLACVAFAGSARAEEDAPHEETDPAALFRGAHEALVAERPGEAIAKLEALADRGVVDAVVSFDRGLAYAARVRAGGEQPGDLGRAAHGFEETRELTRDPTLAADATSALAIVRSEVARRRSRAGESVELQHGSSLGRSIVELLPENAWAVIAAAMTLALSAAILTRRRAAFPRAKVAATTSAAIAGALMLGTSALAWAARDARLHLREGVVIAPNARLLDARHLAMDGVAPVPEGARARIVDESAGFSHVVVGEADGYLPSSAVLPLARR